MNVRKRGEEAASRFRDGMMCVLLALTTLALFWPVSHHSFINFDDPLFVFNNPFIQRGLNLESIRWAFTTTYANSWQPLAWISHMLDIQLFGLAVGWHHLTNVFFHIGSTIILFMTFRRITGHYIQSGFISILFAIHPLHVESVAWIAERKDVLSVFLGMLVLWSYGRYAVSPSPFRYLIVLLFFSLGLLSKPMLVTVPCVLLLLDYWPLQRMQFAPPGSHGHGFQISRNLWLLWEKVPFLALALGVGITTFWVKNYTGAMHSLEHTPLLKRLGNALISYLIYIEKMFYPRGLAVFYPIPKTIDSWHLIGAGCILTVIFWVVLVKRTRYPYLIVGWLWFFITLLPVSGIIQVGSQAMADRYTYFSLIGLFIMVTWGFSDLVQKLRLGRTIPLILAVVVLSILIVMTWFQLKHWRTDLSLFEHTLKVTTDNYLAYNKLGVYAYKEGRYDEAIAHYSEAIKIAPGYSDAINNLGAVYFDQGNFSEALKLFRTSLEITPQAKTLHNIASVYIKQGQLKQALGHYLQAIELDPGFKLAYHNLGLVYSSLGENERAISYLEQALRINPYDALVHHTLGILFYREQNYESAINHLAAAAGIEPDNAQTQSKLGAALARLGRNEEALIHLTKALEINPSDVVSLSNKGTILLKQGQLIEAAECYHQVLEIDSSVVEAHFNLSLILIEQGRLEQAEKHLITVLRFRPGMTMAQNLLRKVQRQR
ncbi:tetratricopeptide repeat protein [candidate division CSSED10-310 bacterium]|uniref:Tetratricopeptide repeat protein n=1 Tax=candidate division CSSED10-310 bacterium TaxID=2855610 RepID=A0ABV6YZ84_UNCC1